MQHTLFLQARQSSLIPFYLLFLNHLFSAVNFLKNQLIDLWIFLRSQRKAIDYRTHISKVHPEIELSWPFVKFFCAPRLAKALL